MEIRGGLKISLQVQVGFTAPGVRAQQIGEGWHHPGRAARQHDPVPLRIPLQACKLAFLDAIDGLELALDLFALQAMRHGQRCPLLSLNNLQLPFLFAEGL